jgi:hypothetical protein
VSTRPRRLRKSLVRHRLPCQAFLRKRLAIHPKQCYTRSVFTRCQPPLFRRLIDAMRRKFFLPGTKAPRNGNDFHRVHTLWNLFTQVYGRVFWVDFASFFFVVLCAKNPSASSPKIPQAPLVSAVSKGESEHPVRNRAKRCLCGYGAAGPPQSFLPNAQKTAGSFVARGVSKQKKGGAAPCKRCCGRPAEPALSFL